MIPEAGFYQPEVRPVGGAGYPLTQDLLFMKKKVVPFLLNHPYSAPFKYPVNAKTEGIFPDYFKVCILSIARSCSRSFVLTLQKYHSAFT